MTVSNVRSQKLSLSRRVRRRRLLSLALWLKALGTACPRAKRCKCWSSTTTQRTSFYSVVKRSAVTVNSRKHHVVRGCPAVSSAFSRKIVFRTFTCYLSYVVRMGSAGRMALRTMPRCCPTRRRSRFSRITSIFHSLRIVPTGFHKPTAVTSNGMCYALNRGCTDLCSGRSTTRTSRFWRLNSM